MNMHLFFKFSNINDLGNEIKIKFDHDAIQIDFQPNSQDFFTA